MPDRTRKAATLVVGVGYVGRRLLARLPDDAIGLSRTASRNRILELDLDDESPSALDVRGDAGVIYTVPPARDAAADLRLRRFLSSLARAPRRIIYLSTTGVYGNRDGAIVDETDAVRPESSRAERRVDAEHALADYCERQQVELVVLRVPGIYGPGRLGSDRIREREPVLDESDANPGNRIHVDDLVRCCVAALDAGVPAGVYNVGDGDERSSTWFADEVARQLGLDSPPRVSRDAAQKTFSPMRLSFLAESRRLSLDKMRDVLGVTPRYADAADGIRASLAAEAARN